jgi:hypothetical protein
MEESFAVKNNKKNLILKEDIIQRKKDIGLRKHA